MVVAILCSNWERLAEEAKEELAQLDAIEVLPTCFYFHFCDHDDDGAYSMAAHHHNTSHTHHMRTSDTHTWRDVHARTCARTQ
jgi:hypothetical protein